MKILQISISIIFYLFCSFYSAYSSYVVAEPNSDDSQYTASVGFSFKQLDFDVYDEGSLSYNGSMTEGAYTTYHISLNSPYRLFSFNKRAGYYFEYGLSDFEMGLQNIATGEQDLGSSVKGSYLYFSPVLFYNFGDQINLKKKDAYLFGIGLGAGYLQAEGDIYFTETTSELFKVDISGFDVAIFVLVEYQHNDWFLRAQGGGPSVTTGGYDYDIFDFSMIVGYSFRI